MVNTFDIQNMKIDALKYLETLVSKITLDINNTTRLMVETKSELFASQS